MDYGVDLSHWNAVNDARAMRASGVTFAICKATDGPSGADATFAPKVAQLRAAGIVVGAYHFARAGDPVAQARHFAAVAGAAGCLTSGALQPALDMEDAAVRGHADSFTTAFVAAVGLPASVYGNLDWWSGALHPAAWGAHPATAGWLARYNGTPGAPGWSYPGLALHQFSDAGTVPGIAGAVDRDATMSGYPLAMLVLGGAVPAPPVAFPVGPATVPAGNTWTVQAGDTLSRVASAWRVTVALLATSNGIPDPDMIHIGQVLHEPGTAGAGPLPATSGGRYTVAAGDTLSGIAASHGTTTAMLVALNAIANPDRIATGQALTLPGAPAATPAASGHTYTVVAGDTLGVIAARLGYPGGWPALARRNGLADPNRITPGQVLRY